jgi:hypothetical protein
MSGASRSLDDRDHLFHGAPPFANKSVVGDLVDLGAHPVDAGRCRRPGWWSRP